MKRIIAFLFALSTGIFSLVYPQSQPVTFNPNMLTYSQGLPNDLLIFAPDTAVQILFNPARAVLFGRNFVYTNYLPQSSSPLSIMQTSSLGSSNGFYFPTSSGPTLSFAALFNNGASPWLLQFSNWVYRNSNSTTTNQTTVPASGTAIISPSDNSSLSSGAITALKLSKIGTTSNGSYSLGVFGIIFPENATSDNASPNDSYGYSSGSAPVVTHQHSSTQTHSPSTNSKYEMGLEYTAAGAEWDCIASLSLQKNIAKSSTLYLYDYSYSYTSPTDTFSNINSTHVSSSKENEPSIIGLHLYYQHSSNLITPLDHFFISPYLYYSDGKITDTQAGYRLSWYQDLSNTPSGDTSQAQSFKDEKTHDWGSQISFGYVMKQRLQDIDIIIAIDPQIGYDDFTDINSFFSGYYSYYSGLLNAFPLNRHQLWSAILQIPIYANFTPAPWYSLFGGLNYRYSYLHEKISSDYPLEQDFLPVQGITVRSGSQILSSLNSTSAVFAGVEFRHASGLQTQIAFKGNLANYSYWNISLGYVY